MKKRVKKFYRFLAWFFSMIIAAGSLAGCRGERENKYGPPVSKYGPPTSYEKKIN
ncbi:hypothetical protein NBE98_12085 [Clostridium swellfunianum]|uniref:hypothetical protein n=1 Tax=Clostridium swellfunianum TaxID=1367462 RepID=UPI00202E811E|nr:hypothetical protein [Clostridium swellfunianum]MCM0649114.1 hypothetical protein [Clostridium swellfunianum]